MNNPTVVFPKPKTIIVEDKEVPRIKGDEVLIRTERSLVSIGTELTILSGEFPPQSYWANYGKYPFTPGYDNIGMVVDAGPDADRSLIGKTVASYSPHAMYVSASQKDVMLVPQGVSMDEASFFTIAEIVMNGVRRSQLSFGESVVIYGAGILGQLTARICKMAGAMPVIVVDVSDNRLEYLPGNIFKINPLKQDVASEVERLTKGRMADIVFEVTGNQNLIVEEFKCLRRLGRFVVLSSPRGPTYIDLHDYCNAPSFTIIGAHNMSHPPVETLNNPWSRRRHVELFFDMLQNKELDVSRLITHKVPYKDAPEIYGQLLKDRTKALGVILVWESH
ncbi:MAG: zinc-binding dehydrogenase [Candidatus Brockarchaeota archaeon]|nr:zinc-binding dehydrogenase [Candidatus Brockarchaeota archaeon]